MNRRKVFNFDKLNSVLEEEEEEECCVGGGGGRGRGRGGSSGSGGGISTPQPLTNTPLHQHPYNTTTSTPFPFPSPVTPVFRHLPSNPSTTTTTTTSNRQHRHQVSGNSTKFQQYMDKRVMVKLNGGRVVEGTLRGFDPFMNLVVDEGVEVRKGSERVRIGVCVIRGSSIIMLEALDRIS